MNLKPGMMMKTITDNNTLTTAQPLPDEFNRVEFSLENTGVCLAYSPNSRVHWAVKARAGKAARWQSRIAALGALSEMLPTVFDPETVQLPVKVTITRHYTGKAKVMDTDNLGATLKPFLDGLADALGIDDKPSCMAVERAQVRGSDTRLAFVVEWQQVNNNE